MLGRMKLSLPVCTFITAPPWAGFVPYTECTKHRSSTRRARLGNRSLTELPLWPYCLNSQGDLSRLVVELNCTRGLANGNGLPSSGVSRGLGSNVSTCE